MSEDAAKILAAFRAGFEPAVVDWADERDRQKAELKSRDIALASIAVSLKRIADMMPDGGNFAVLLRNAISEGMFEGFQSKK